MMEPTFARRHLLGLQDMSAAEILTILDQAASLREISDRAVKKVPALRGKTVINLFYERSTRTRTSFEIAAKRLSADTVNVAADSSSVAKGETLVDTVRNLEAMRPDAIGRPVVGPHGVPGRTARGQRRPHARGR
jgi:aspartate carbamoyltransferase catalytic subunit